MALDHYVSQVHLKRFAAPDLNGRIYAIRKNDLKRFQPRTKDVCRTDEGNTNKYLIEPRIIEEFLRSIEGRYTAAVAKFQMGDPDREAVYVVAGFAAYVLTCSPAAMRINSTPLAGIVRNTVKILEGGGRIPPSPSVFGGRSLSELLESGSVIADIDEKFPQAIGITSIINILSNIGNSYCEILINDHEDCPFFTSDYPAAIEYDRDIRIINRVLPLDPTIAVRFRPNIDRPRDIVDLEFRDFRFLTRRVTRGEAVELNRSLIRTAENIVFFRDDRPWVPGIIEKNRHFRAVCRNIYIPQKSGITQWTRTMLESYENI